MVLSTSSRHRMKASAGILALVIGSGLLAVGPRAAQAVNTVPNPPGFFLVRADLSIPAEPFPNHVFANADRTSEYLAGNQLCRMRNNAGESHPFVTDTIEILKPGTFTFRIVNSPGIYDPFLAVFDGSFNKTSPDTGVLGCNDDIDDNDAPYDEVSDGDLFDNNGYDNYAYPPLDDYYSLFEVTLQPGTYTIMLATYDDYVDNDGWYGVNGDISTAALSGTATSTFEYWGPEGGIAGGVGDGGGSPEFGNEDYLDYLNERVAAETASDLPNTGSSSTVVNLTVAVGFLAAGMTLVSVSRRRRLN